MTLLKFIVKNVFNIYFFLSNRIKKLGIALLAVPAMQMIYYLALPAHAGEKILSAADNNLILTSSALVLLMTPGLAFF